MPTPPSRIYASAAELLDDAAGLDYPIVVKPDTKRHAAVRATSALELASTLKTIGRMPGVLIVQPYLQNQLHGVVGVMWRGQLHAAMHMKYRRLWPLPCGTVASAETTAADERLEARLTHLLEAYEGVFHADFAGPYLLDLNPRVHATLPLALAAGINPIGWYCDLLRGLTPPPARAEPGVLFRWLEGDIRSVLRATCDGEIGVTAALHELSPRRRTVHSYESLADPGPMWMRTRFLARRLVGRPDP